MIGWLRRLHRRRKVSAAVEWTRRSESLLSALRGERERLELIRGELEESERRTASRLAEAERLELLHRTAVEELQSSLRVLEDTTVPGLVEAHQLLLERTKALTAIEVARQTAFLPSAATEDE